MNKIKKIFFSITIFLFFFISIYNIISRIKWENHQKEKFFVIDIDYFPINDIERIKTDLNYRIFFSVNYDFFLNNYSSFLNKEVILKIDKDKRYDFYQISEFIEYYSDKIFSIIFSPQININCFEPKELNSNSDKKITNKELKLLIEKNNFIKLNFEFNKEKIFSEKTLALRSFMLDLNINKELNLTQQKNLAVLKIKKAIFERNCNLIYIIPSEYLNYDENINLIKDMLKNFVIRNNFKITTFNTISFGKINNILVLFFAIIVPLMIYKNIPFNEIELKLEFVYIKTNFLVLSLGIFIWGFMQGYEYIVLEKKIIGTKIMFFLPIILSPFFIFDKSELKKISGYEVKLRDIFVILVLAIIFLYIFLRTGNIGKEFVLRYEICFREFIEKKILFRPRFKEMFFAQPLFLFSLYLMKRYKKIIWTKMLFCISILSQVSVINTFLHIHTPIHLCILRSIIGIFLGLLIGEIIIFILKKINRERNII